MNNEQRDDTYVKTWRESNKYHQLATGWLSKHPKKVHGKAAVKAAKRARPALVGR